MFTKIDGDRDQVEAELILELFKGADFDHAKVETLLASLEKHADLKLVVNVSGFCRLT